jgi:hypothetical protein
MGSSGFVAVLARPLPAAPLAGPTSLQPEKSNDFKSLIDLKILNSV